MKNTVELYEHITEVTQGVHYKKINKEVILDGELSWNDLGIYLALQFACSFEKKEQELWTSISNKKITQISGIEQKRQHLSLSKLEKKGYIERRLGRYGYEYKTIIISKNYLRLPLCHLEGLKKDVRSYVRKLRYITLSNGNNILPSLKTCQSNMKITKPEFYILKKIGEEFGEDVEIYDSLKSNAKEGSSKHREIIKLRAQQNKTLEDITIGIEHLLIQEQQSINNNLN